MANTWPTTLNDWAAGEVIESAWADALEDNLGITGAFNFSRAATVIVAANDANAQWKANADYICDGTADEVQIEAAIATKKEVLLSEGIFNTSSQIDVSVDACRIRGMGIGVTTIKRTANTTDKTQVLIVNTKTSGSDWYVYDSISDLTIDANGLCEAGLVVQGARGIYENIEVKGNNQLTSTSNFSLGVYGNNNIFRNIHIQPPLKTASSTETGNELSNCALFVSDGDNCFKNTFDGIYIDGNDIAFNGQYGGISLEDSAYQQTFDNIHIRRIDLHAIATDAAVSGQDTGLKFNNIVIDDCGAGINISSTYLRTVINNIYIKDLKDTGTDSTGITIVGDQATLTNFHIENTPKNSGPYSAIDIQGEDTIVSNGTISSGFGYGILVSDSAERTNISNCHIFTRKLDGIRIQNIRSGTLPIDTRISNCYIYNNDQASTDNMGILDFGTRTRVYDCHLFDDQVTQTQNYGLDLAGADGHFYRNYLAGNTAGAINIGGGASGTKITQNAGYVTENNGTGSIASGATSATITHGLGVTPAAKNISITLTENPSNTPGAIWVDTITSTQFNVNCENDPGVSNLDFSWQAIVL